MSLRRVICACFVVVLISSFVSVSADQNESEPQTLIKSARFLEENPLDKKAKEVRRWAVSWIIQTDKVSVKVCSLIVGGLGKKYQYESELFGQYTIGMAAFKLANPEKAGDEDGAQLAGIESTILAYEAILKAQAKARNIFMDDLIAKRTNGTLADFVLANNCKGKP